MGHEETTNKRQYASQPEHSYPLGEEDELISKKELLEITGISYGQLYRWKRKHLIPEEWFIRRSTFTGQETFFPRKKILQRIERIKSLKDDLSLDELATLFSPHPSNIALSKAELLERNIVSKVTLDFFVDQLGDVNVFPFEKVLFAYVLEKMLKSGEMSLDEGKALLQVLTNHYPKLAGKNGELVFLRKMGVPVFLLVSSPVDLYVEDDTKIVRRLDLASCVEELKLLVT